MKLYCKTPRRIAKKKIGNRWKKLLYGATLKVGDLISSCKGFNERIKEIQPEWTDYKMTKGRYICDFTIITESGHCCSLLSCCTYPLETKDQIEAYWSYYKTPEGMKKCEQNQYKSRVVQGIIDGKDVFDSDGQPYYEFAEDHEREARFEKS